MRGTFLSASYPACGDDRMYDLHHGLLAVQILRSDAAPIVNEARASGLARHVSAYHSDPVGDESPLGALSGNVTELSRSLGF